MDRAHAAPDCQERGEKRARILGGGEPGDAGVTAEPHALAPGERPGAGDGGLERGVERRLAARRGGRAPPCNRWPGGRCATAARPRRAPGPPRPGPRPASRGTARAILRANVARGSQTPAWRPGTPGAPNAPRPGPNDENGRPVIRITSSARTMRRELPGSMRPAATGRAPRARRTRRGGRPGRDLGLELGPELEVLARERRARRRRPARTTRSRRRAAPACRAPRCRRSRRAPRVWNAGDGPFVERIRDVDQVVRHCRALGDRWLRGADVQAAVDLHRVEGDDLDVAAARARHRARAPTSPTRSGPTSARWVTSEGSPGAAVTGMGMRTRGVRGASTRTSSPRSQCGRPG